ncbi:MAG TPA: hypothetical protein VFH55_08975 [Nitrospiria bacterium]|nr:hypothetical protein [Nitrospiria bacterium]
MSNDQKNKTTNQTRRLRWIVTLSALVFAGIHLIWPLMAIDVVTLTLLVIALVPWLAPVFKSLEFPGGWKVEFQELQKVAVRAEQAGLLAAKDAAPQPEYTFQRVAEHDPNLALAGLRIEIEKRLVALAETHGVGVQGRGLGQLLRILAQRQILTDGERSVLSDLTELLNSAVHGATVDDRAAEWAMDVGPLILKALDDLVSGSP